MLIEHQGFTSNTQKILNLVEEASAENGVIRWAGLRDTGMYKSIAGPKLYIPLDNDGNLIQQFIGLEKWCQRFADNFGFSKHESSLIALAYVARQLRRGNHLLNNQSKDTKQIEGHNLEQIRSYYFGNDRPANDDRTPSDMFQLVAHTLTTLTDPPKQQGLDAEYLATIQKAAGLLEKANAAFYLETGTTALLWACQAKEWAKTKAATKKQRKAITAKAKSCANRLAANAYTNNVHKLPPKLIEEILNPLTRKKRIAMGDPDMCIRSRYIASNTPISIDRITPQELTKLQQ